MAEKESASTRRDAHALVGMGWGNKVLATVGVAAGLATFLAASGAGIVVTSWEVSLQTWLHWGEPLAKLRGHAPGVFGAVLAAHALSLVLVVAVANALFRKVALPRAARRALAGVCIMLGFLDIAAWLALPGVPLARAALGPLIGLTTLSLVLLSGRPLWDMWVFTRWRNASGQKKRVVIVGGGFAGLYTALGVDRRLGYHKDLEIVVLDKRNYFLFPPLLPSVATGAIETRQVTYPFRRIFEATNIVFRKETVTHIDVDRKVIRGRADVDDDPQTGQAKAIHTETPYDILVLSPGSETQTFGTKGVQEHAFFMRELGDAMAVRNHVIDCFERAARQDDGARRRELLRFVIVGAGPTGVELASEMRDLVAHVLFNRYPEIAPSDVEILIVQSGPQILPGWNAKLVAAAQKQLEMLRIRVLTNRRVVQVDPFFVLLDGQERIDARTCIWCAGVKPAGLLGQTGLVRERSGRVPIEPDLRARGQEAVFVLGDAAHCLDGDKPLPPLGQVAFQQGSAAANNIVALLRGAPTKPFRYFNFGSLVSVGERFAAIDLFGVRMKGFLAWLIWRTLYWMKLVGFGNKVRVVLDWTLDLVIERSISQIAVTRQDLGAETEPASRPRAA